MLLLLFHVITIQLLKQTKLTSKTGQKQAIKPPLEQKTESLKAYCVHESIFLKKY